MSHKNILSSKEVAALLKLPLVTIQRWEHQGKIPFKIIKNKRCYKQKEILEWAKSHDFIVNLNKLEQQNHKGIFLSQAIEMGGIYYDVPGTDIYGTFENAITLLPFISKKDHDKLLNELLNREELASTGVGNGIAIPHTRNRLNLGLYKAFVPIFFLKNSVEFNSVDGIAVNTLLMIFSTNTKEHLKLLSEISYMLKNKEILNTLKNIDQNNDLLEKMVKIENEIIKV